MDFDLTMPRDIYLPLYGRVEHDANESMAWNLCQTEALARLRDISLACTPSRYVPHGQAANRFQHSVGASVLARQLCDQEAELSSQRDLLVAACLLHDSASPPFSHVAEPFLYARSGLHHDQAVAGVLAAGGEVATVLEEHDVNPERVLDTICGRGPLGPLMAGSIDLDNIDNSLHLLISLGFTGKLPYKPQRLTKALRYKNGRASIALDDISFAQLLGWRAARRELYNRLGSLVYLSSTSMLYRAIDLADQAGAIENSFFTADETEALTILKSSTEGSQILLSALQCWRQYPCSVYRVEDSEDPRIPGLYGNVALRRQAADQIASILDLAPHQVCLYAGREKGYRAIDLSFSGEPQLVKAAQAAFAASQPRQAVAIFVDKSAALSEQRVEAAWQMALRELPATLGAVHSFF